MSPLTRSLWTVASVGIVVSAGSIADIDHIVLFMQENRAFDHYFGTMAGIRGFSDPNVQVNDGKPLWYQKVNSTLTNATDALLPWYLNYLGGHWVEATQCIEAGDNGWSANHDALDGGLNDNWPVGNTPWSWGHFTRNELPNHFAIAEGWTVGDMYQESVIASTNPNRVTWISGSINAPGSPQSPSEGGMTIDNNETPGCEGTNLNCYPLQWQTVPEIYQEAGLSWQVYQDTDNFDDNPLAWFEQFQKALPTSPLAQRGMSFVSLEKFYLDAATGTLPQISYIVGPAELSEHPPYQPKDGAWLQQRVVDAVTQSPKYNSTALIISYDETGGFGDHVVPFHSPSGTPGEWVNDPYGDYGYVYTGPGFRLPFYIVSPWTRGGNVYVENADHNSQIKFVEQWAEAKGLNVTTTQMPSWRRENMADLTKAFNFASPDYSIPSMPNISYPSIDSTGDWNGYAVCEATYAVQRPPVPYGNQTAANSLISEQGFKAVRGQLTEGRYLVFEMNGYALTNTSRNFLSTTKASAQHDSKAQRFVLTQLTSGGNTFTGISGTLTINDLGSGLGHSLMNAEGAYLTIGSNGRISYTLKPAGFSVFSVT